METLKYILEYVGLVTSAIFGILATVFETHTTYVDNSAGHPVEKKKINRWGKWAIVGICVSFLISGASKLVESAINKRDEEIKSVKEDRDARFRDSLITRTNSISSNLYTSLDIATTQSDSLRKMIEILSRNNLMQDSNLQKQNILIGKTKVIVTKLDSVEIKQNVNLGRQEDIMSRTDVMMHPLFPLQLQFKFEIDLDRMYPSSKRELDSIASYFRAGYDKSLEPYRFHTSTTTTPFGGTVTHLTYYQHEPFSVDRDNAHAKAVMQLEEFIYANFLPNSMEFIISKSSDYNELLSDDINFALKIREIADNSYYLNDAYFDLIMVKESNSTYNACTIIFNLNIDESAIHSNNSGFSLLQYSKGSIFIRIQPLLVNSLKPQFNGAKADLTFVSLNCGPNFLAKYPFQREDIILIRNTDDKVFQIKIGED